MFSYAAGDLGKGQDHYYKYDKFKFLQPKRIVF